MSERDLRRVVRTHWVRDGQVQETVTVDGAVVDILIFDIRSRRLIARRTP